MCCALATATETLDADRHTSADLCTQLKTLYVTRREICHTRYIIGANPYSNGSYIVAERAGGNDIRKLFCWCCAPQYHEFKLSDLKVYAVPQAIFERGYGSAAEIICLSREEIAS
jgi:hypothetical protein